MYGYGKVTCPILRARRCQRDAGMEDFEDINNSDELWREIQERGLALGLPSAAFSVVRVKDQGRAPDWRVWHNAPDAYLESFFDLSECRRDPVQQHMRTSSRPLVWDWSTYQAADAGDLYDAQHGFGFVSGIAVTVHRSPSEHVLLGFDHPGELSTFGRHLPWLVSQVVQMAQAAAKPALRLTAVTNASPSADLTMTEQVVLALLRDLGSPGVVAERLGVTRRVVVDHLLRAAEKLAVPTDQLARVPLAWGDTAAGALQAG